MLFLFVSFEYVDRLINLTLDDKTKTITHLELILKKFKALILGIAAIATTVAATPKPAEAYASFEYPFFNMGKNIQQSTGQNNCINKYNSLKGVWTGGYTGFDPYGWKRSVPILSGYGRGYIVDPWWVWYDGATGLCVANTNTIIN